MVTIGCYGASDISWSGYSYPDKYSGVPIFSWNDLMCKAINAEQINKSVMQGAIERTVLNVKATKQKLDLAIIVIGSTAAIPLINCDRDIDAGSSVFDHTAEQLFTIKGVSSHPKHISDKNVTKKFGSHEEFVQTLTLWKKHLWSSELQLLRFNGALMQLDQYLVAKKIPAIYIGRERRHPLWLRLEAGKVHEDLYELFKKYNQYDNLPNNITAEGQKEIAKVYIKLVKEILNSCG